MSFFDGFLAGLIVSQVLVVFAVTVAYRLRQPRWKQMEEFSKRGQDLITAGNNPTTWTSDEKREAWMQARQEWQNEVREWEQKGK